MTCVPPSSLQPSLLSLRFIHRFFSNLWLLFLSLYMCVCVHVVVCVCGVFTYTLIYDKIYK